MKNLSLMAHRLGAEIDKLEAMKLFSANANDAAAAPTGSVSISWGEGSATVGYKELSHAMSIIVSQNWRGIRQEAIRLQTLRVQALRDEMRVELAAEQADQLVAEHAAANGGA